MFDKVADEPLLRLTEGVIVADTVVDRENDGEGVDEIDIVAHGEGDDDSDAIVDAE